MLKDDLTLRIPNPHQGDIGKELLARLLRQAGIDKDEWEHLLPLHQTRRRDGD